MLKKRPEKKRTFAALTTLTAAAALGLSAHSVSADTLVGFWNFDGTTHLEMTPGAGHAGDWANLTNGTIFGSGVTFVEDDILGSTVAKFTNAGGIKVGTFPLISAGSPDFSFSAYVQNQESTNDVIMGNRYPDAGGGYNFFKVTKNKLEYQIGGSNHSTEYGLLVGSEWEHIAVTREGNTLNYYVNGSLISTKAMTVDMKAPIQFGLGGDSANNTEYWTGLMDSFSVYASAQKHSDIILQSAARYNGMTAYWNTADYTEGKNWVDRINGQVADFAPSSLNGAAAKFEFDRDLTPSETAWYTAAASADHVYDQSGAWNTAAPTVPTTAWVYEGTVDYAAPTAPAGMYVGGGTAAAALNLQVDQLNTINLTRILRNGTVTTSAGGTDFGKTIEVDGGTLNTTAGWFNLTGGARVTLSRGTISAAGVRVGQGSGNVEVNQYGGTFQTTGNVFIADNSTSSTGTYNMYSGNFACGDTICVGQYQGVGTMNVYGGTVTAAKYIYVSYTTDSTGVLNIHGGTVRTNIDLAVGQSANNTNGTLNIYGGKVETVGHVSLGNVNNAPRSTMNMTGGTVISHGGFLIARKPGTNASANISGGFYKTHTGIYAGDSGTGTLTLSGGSLTAKQKMYVGTNAGASGTVSVEDGMLSAPVAYIGQAGKGHVAQSGGTVLLPDMQLGTSLVDGKSSIYSLSGGSLYTRTITGAAGFDFTGGKLVTNSVDSSLNQLGGTLEVRAASDGLNWRRFEGQSPAITDAIWNDLDSLTPSASGIGIVGASDSIPDKNTFMTSYDGYIYVPEAGNYTFHINVDDNAQIFIDGKSIGSGSWVDYYTYQTGSAELTAGLHPIQINMREGSGGQSLDIDIEKTGTGNRVDLNTPGILFSDAPLNAEIGTLEIAGDYTMAEEAVLNLDIDLSKGIADQLVISGDVETNGVLNLIFSGELSQDASFQLFDVAGDANFGFSEIHLLSNPYDDSNWNLTGLLAGGDGILRSTGLPEPSTWLLLVCGAFGMMTLRRRGKVGNAQ